MTLPNSSEQIDSLVTELDRVNPISHDLGTPEVCEIDAVRQLVAMGASVVPQLLEHMQGDIPKKRVAYLVLVLSQIGDVRALATLTDLCALYEQRETKDEWDYAVIGQCKLAVEQLEKKAQ